MNETRTSVDELIAGLAPIRDEDLAAFSASPGAGSLFEEIVAGERFVTSKDSHAAAEPPIQRHRRGGRPGRRAAAVLPVMAVAGLALALLVGPSPIRPAPAAAGIHFTMRDGFIVANVTDPSAGRDQLRAAFSRRGIDIELELVPVSPSAVGTVASMGGSGIDGIQTLQGRCVTPGGGCPVGLRIPADFHGHARIQLGRSARADERYVSAGNPFAPGEALHCSGLRGANARRAQAELRRRGLDAEWHTDDVSNSVVDSGEVHGFVTEAVSVSRRQLVIWVDGERPPAAGHNGRVTESDRC